MTSSIDVFGIGNPLIDLLAQVDDSFLKAQDLEKNRMYLVDQERHQGLLEALDGLKVQAQAAGSCANTMLGIAQLGGRSAYCGKVGDDEYGRLYAQQMDSAGVQSHVQAGEHLTGSTVILVAPDASRTMNTYLGACQDLGPEDLPLDAIRQAKLLYVTGYLWDTPRQQAAVELALQTAKAADIPVAMSLSDPFCVNRHKADFRRILTDYVDLVFANKEEAQHLVDAEHSQEALRGLLGLCWGAVVTLGGSGALVNLSGEETLYLDALPIHAVDTTGAGDAFAAGFLYGQSHGYNALRCGRLGTRFAAAVIEQVGPRLEGDVRARLKADLHD